MVEDLKDPIQRLSQTATESYIRAIDAEITARQLIGMIYGSTGLNVDLLKIPGRAELVLSRLPMNRFGELEELVGTAIYLATDASSYVTGTTIPVEGGFLALGF